MKSNLGTYQWMTTTSKKVGGPVNLLLLAGAAGVGVYKASEVTVKKVINVIKGNKANKQKVLDAKVYTVLMPGKSEEGVDFAVDEQFRVIETDGDAILIEKINDENNPYFVSVELLNAISDYI